ncbi:hypothetical protein D3C76_1549900 [compost metagenome]
MKRRKIKLSFSQYACFDRVTDTAMKVEFMSSWCVMIRRTPGRNPTPWLRCGLGMMGILLPKSLRGANLCGILNFCSRN